MWEEFKKFAMRGNVIDLAVGVIIGAAFGAIVTSLVGDIIMPIVGAVTGGLDFTNYYTPLSAKVDASVSYADAKKQGAVLGWGQFLTAAINFLIIAWVLFIAIKGINRLKREEPAAAPAEPTAEVKLLTENSGSIASVGALRCAIACKSAPSTSHVNRCPTLTMETENERDATRGLVLVLALSLNLSRRFCAGDLREQGRQQGG